MLDKSKNSSARSMGLQVHCCRFQMFVVLLFRNVSNGVLEQNGNYQSHGQEKSKWKKIKNRNQIRWDTYTYLYSYFYYLIRTPILNNRNQRHVGKKKANIERPVRVPLNLAWSASFFIRNSIFLSQIPPDSSRFLQANGAKIKNRN